MPTYDLVCDDCAHEFETFRQGFLRDEDRSCPNCGAAARQLITGFITAKPSRGAPVTVNGGGGCGGACGCGGH